MRITKCDLCKKKIRGKAVIAGFGFLETKELCEKCGFPIMKFLKKNKFLEKEKKITKI